MNATRPSALKFNGNSLRGQELKREKKNICTVAWRCCSKSGRHDSSMAQMTFNFTKITKRWSPPPTHPKKMMLDCINTYRANDLEYLQVWRSSQPWRGDHSRIAVGEASNEVESFHLHPIAPAAFCPHRTGGRVEGHRACDQQTPPRRPGVAAIDIDRPQTTTTWINPSTRYLMRIMDHQPFRVDLVKLPPAVL